MFRTGIWRAGWKCMRADRSDAREANFSRPFRRFPYTRMHARDCFGSRRCRGNANSHGRGDIHNTMPLITHCLCDGSATIPLFFPCLSPIVAVSLVNTRHAFEQIIIRYQRNAERSVIWSLSVMFLLSYYDFLPARRKEEREREWKRLAYPFRRRRKWQTAIKL